MKRKRDMHSRPAVRFTTTLVFVSGDAMVEGGRRVSQARSGPLHKTRVLSKRVVRNRPTIHDLPSLAREARRRRCTEDLRGASGASAEIAVIAALSHSEKVPTEGRARAQTVLSSRERAAGTFGSCGTARVACAIADRRTRYDRKPALPLKTFDTRLSNAAAEG